MTRNRRFDETVSKWLEETAPARLPDRVLDVTFERTRRSRQHVGWRLLLMRFRITRIAPALGGAAVLVMATALALGLYAGQPGVGGPALPPAASNTPAPTQTEAPSPTLSPDGRTAAVVGNWESYGDADGGHQTMDIARLPNGTYEVTIRDDLASVCDRVSSTMTGVAEAHEPGTIVIAQPDYVCDDGSEAQALSGPPLEEQLQNLGFTYDPARDELRDSFGAVWSRVAAVPSGEEASPSPTAASDVEALAFVGSWEATDPPPDSSNLTMEIARLRNGTYDVTIRDDLASVCDGVSSTMTGVAEAQEPGTIVIAQPDYVCDDGSEAQALSGPPLDEQLQNMGFTYNPVIDELQDSLGLIWSRVAMSP